MAVGHLARILDRDHQFVPGNDARGIDVAEYAAFQSLGHAVKIGRISVTFLALHEK
jgi:hypothetical protein